MPSHVLLVEDSMIIALDTEDCLRELGVEKVQIESSVIGALSAIARKRKDERDGTTWDPAQPLLDGR